MIDQRKTILIAGGSGLIGSRLSYLLNAKKYAIRYLTRNKKANGVDTFLWDPEKKQIDERAFKNVDVIINLAGENIASKRWTARRKRKIINSRIFATNLLYESLKRIPNTVELLINASATGIYGDTNEMIIHEDDPYAADFLGQTCQRWEAAAHQFEKIPIRTVIFRIGLVLSSDGGVLPPILQMFKFRFALYFGSGKQYMSWIHIDDLCNMFLHSIRNENMKGVYNAVAPGPLSNKNFIKLIAQIKGDNYFLIGIPTLPIKFILGEMSNLLLHGCRVSSKKIEEYGFKFHYSQANQALRNILGK